MIRKTLTLLMPVALLIVLASGIMSDNGIAGKVGSPGENKCTECHNSYALNSGAGSIELRTGMTNNQYVPGQVYTFVFKVAYPGRNLFGMGLEALTSTYANAGTLANTSNKTLLKSATIGTTSRRSIVHNYNTGTGTDSTLFTFNWTAPASGTVTFYYCGVATNHNASDLGDYVYSGSMVVNPVSTTGMSEVEPISALNTFPNPVNDRLSVEFNSSCSDAVVSLIDMAGKCVRTETITTTKGGRTTLTWSGLEGLPAGTYLLSVRSGDAVSTRRVVVL